MSFIAIPEKIIRKEEAHEAAIRGGNMEKTARKTPPPHTHLTNKQQNTFPFPSLEMLSVPDLANQIASCWLLFRHALAPAGGGGGGAAAAFLKKRIL